MKELMLTGVTADTPKNLQLNAGVLLKNFDIETNTISDSDIIGATRGGGTLSFTPTIRQVEADGIPTNFKSMQRIDEWTAQLQATLIEFRKDTLKLALGASVKEVDQTNYTELSVGHEVGDTDYSDMWWVGQTGDGSYLAVKLENSLNLAGLSVTLTNKGEGTYGITLTAHYQLSDLKDKHVPFKIYVPKEGE